MLRNTGVDVPPVAMRIESTVPIGAGLSSSAALEVAVLRGFRALLNIDMDDIQLAKLARRAEAEYAGVSAAFLESDHVHGWMIRFALAAHCRVGD